MNKININDFAKKIGQQTPDWSQDGSPIVFFEVPIERLYFNDDNGRIATWISIYNDDPNVVPLDELEREEYNKIIHDYVKKSNTPQSYDKTYQDIKIKGQINPGVILADGRIVSGNRRFAILRDLYNETGNEKFRFFKCFIIDKDLFNEHDRKDIKTIERLTQFGVDGKVDYDPIDRLVDIYNDLVGPKKMWTINEYTKKLSLKKSEVDTMYHKAVVMADYLTYINKPNKFYLAKEYKLDGPLQEIGKLYKKIPLYEWKRIRVVFYAQFKAVGDRTRVIRDLVKVYNDNPNGFDKMIKKVSEDIEEQEAKLIESKVNQIDDKFDDNSVAEIQLQFNPLADAEDVISEETHRVIFDTVQQTKIDVKKQDKINRLYDAIEIIQINLYDTFDLADKKDKEKIIQKIKELKELLKRFK